MKDRIIRARASKKFKPITLDDLIEKLQSGDALKGKSKVIYFNVVVDYEYSVDSFESEKTLPGETTKRPRISGREQRLQDRIKARDKKKCKQRLEDKQDSDDYDW